MTEVLIWALAAIFFAVACIAVWFFLKLFFRFALVVAAIFFLIAFLYRYELLPEHVSKQVGELILKAQEIVHERVEEKKPSPKKVEAHRRAEHTEEDACDFVFC